MDKRSFTQTYHKKSYIDIRGQGLFAETFSTVIFSCYKFTDHYNRSYIKIQNLLANIDSE